MTEHSPSPELVEGRSPVPEPVEGLDASTSSATGSARSSVTPVPEPVEGRIPPVPELVEGRSSRTRLPRRTRPRRTPGAVAFLVVALVFTLVPIVYLISVSVMSRADVASGILFPTNPVWGNWAAAFGQSNLPRGIVNSLIAAILGAVLTLAFALPAAWAMVRYRTGGKTLAGTILSPWLLPPIVAVIPIFTLLRILGLNNTLAGLTLVYAFANTAVAVWLLEGFVRKLPVELDEAAQLDGAGAFRVLFSIVTPLLTPGLVAVGVIVAVLNYNEFVLATFLTQGPDAQTVPVVLSLMLGERIQDFGKIAAASLIGVIPVFAAAAFLQRWLVAGLTSGSVK
ncbi:carbohydrate ABC transporter permease [Plantibacter sp. YIM 135249]|uniref:carbohydrate ABC transporter permease n=1 Tax=Plantibacter sp. YIM 135249 TaxID=3423918 RepID=UPI003D348F4F